MRREEAWRQPLNSEIYEFDVATGDVRALTDREGPDEAAAVSPNGKKIAYLGFDDRYQGYQLTRLYVMNRDGSDSRLISEGLDRSVSNPTWAGDGKSILATYTDEGVVYLARFGLDGKVRTVATGLGGRMSAYAGGSFSLASGGEYAFAYTESTIPSDVAVGTIEDDEPRRITAVNDDLLGHKTLGAVEEIRYKSSFDGREIQGWIITPPDYDASKKYPLILELHGGPFAAYGPGFDLEKQLMAAAGYVVLYTNPRGSTSYGETFGNLIHHAYPGNDYDDLMSSVDAVLERGYVDPEQLYVTGGSGGGVLTAWIVGKTDRFRAAVVAKPVINWTSFALTSDGYPYYHRYWFGAYPWDDQAEYWRRSPLSLVGNVTTPTMLLTGEEDYRTPIGESEQYYQALKLREVDTALVRIPGASHGIAARPSRLMAKVAHVLGWFGRYAPEEEGS
jgi:dipeptidyl aminopeptidase/acylaminoacyl peptidase